MRREYLEDAVLVVGGAIVIAGAWIVYWPAGLLAAGMVLILFAVLAHRHRISHRPKVETHPPRDRDSEFVSAAAWRFHGPHHRVK
jgi:hypothetical protein